MVTRSRTFGMLCTATRSAVSKQAAITGSAEFFAPLIATVPRSALPPRIKNLSIRFSLCPLYLCVSFSFSLAERCAQISPSRFQLLPRHPRPYSQLQHHQRHPHTVSRRPQSVLRRRHLRPAGLHQNPHRPPLQLLIRHHCVNHQVLIRVSQPHHHGCTKHVQDHLLRRSRLQPRRPRQHFRPDVHADRNLRKLCQRHVLVRSDRDRRRTSSPRVLDSRQHIRRRSASRNSHHHITFSHSCSPQSSDAGVRVIFRAFHCARHGVPSSRNECPYRFMRNAKRRRNLRRIQHSHPSARS